VEGHRFFDLVRWGIASPAINAFIGREKLIPGPLKANEDFTGKK